ncbi:hypothetical protein BDZ91DRAFT_740061 [Kalaharituber pfeilii]|nr:hypothetical protein BDZ91DRAFT_740061 [Kalaharituber pfeilii]
MYAPVFAGGNARDGGSKFHTVSSRSTSLYQNHDGSSTRQMKATRKIIPSQRSPLAQRTTQRSGKSIPAGTGRSRSAETESMMLGRQMNLDDHAESGVSNHTTSFALGDDGDDNLTFCKPKLLSPPGNSPALVSHEYDTITPPPSVEGSFAEAPSRSARMAEAPDASLRRPVIAPSRSPTPDILPPYVPHMHSLKHLTPDLLTRISFSLDPTDPPFVIPKVTIENLLEWESRFPELEESQETTRYEYNARSQEFIIKCAPSAIHQTFPDMFAHQMGFLLHDIGVQTTSDCGFAIGLGSQNTGFSNSKTSVARASRKIPDFQVYLQPTMDDDEMEDDSEEDFFPTIVGEVGFSERFPALLEDARLYLTHTTGRTRLAILLELHEHQTVPYLVQNPPRDVEKHNVHGNEPVPQGDLNLNGDSDTDADEQDVPHKISDDGNASENPTAAAASDPNTPENRAQMQCSNSLEEMSASRLREEKFKWQPSAFSGRNFEEEFHRFMNGERGQEKERDIKGHMEKLLEQWYRKADLDGKLVPRLVESLNATLHIYCQRGTEDHVWTWNNNPDAVPEDEGDEDMICVYRSHFFKAGAFNSNLPESMRWFGLRLGELYGSLEEQEKMPKMMKPFKDKVLKFEFTEVARRLQADMRRFKRERAVARAAKVIEREWKAYLQKHAEERKTLVTGLEEGETTGTRQDEKKSRYGRLLKKRSGTWQGEDVGDDNSTHMSIRELKKSRMQQN